MTKQSKTPIAFSLALSASLSKPHRELKLTTDLVLELPQHRLALDRELLRKFLDQPIRANKIPTGVEREKWIVREKWIKREHDAKIKAMFAFYGVPDILDDLDRWQWLAICLAGKVFAGCRTIRVGQGGRPKESEGPKIELLRLFDEYKASHPSLSDKAIAQNLLLTKHKAICTAAKLYKPGSVVNAMRRMRDKQIPTPKPRA
jgi:hypothetical protein